MSKASSGLKAVVACCLVSSVCLALIGGCHKSPFALVPVSGTVTMNGQPLANGVVSFQPVATIGDNAGPGSSGRCDAAGRFTLATQTVENKPGAVVGEHRVLISMTGPSREIAPDNDEDVVVVKEQVPIRYNLRSELSFTVPSDGTDQANFELTK